MTAFSEFGRTSHGVATAASIDVMQLLLHSKCKSFLPISSDLTYPRHRLAIRHCHAPKRKEGFYEVVRLIGSLTSLTFNRTQLVQV
jgi:hypothetical protein